MRRTRLGAAVPAVASCLAALMVAPASATSPAPTTAGADIERTLLFSGSDLWHTGGFLYGGFLWSDLGLDRDGLVIKYLAGTGTYRYFSGAQEIAAAQIVTSVMPGWSFVKDKFQLRVFGGVDLQQHWHSPDDPSSRLRGSAFGLRFGLETWWEPVPGETMTRAAASWSTVGTSYGVEAAVGWRVLERFHGGFYVGPELQALGDGDYRQIRLGAHMTALRLGTLEWSAGAGVTTDSDSRTGPYLRFGVLSRH